MSTDAVQVPRYMLTLWATLAREAEQAAVIEAAPTTLNLVKALASYLNAGLGEPVPAPDERHLVTFVEQRREQRRRWDADYAASHEPMAAERLVGTFAEQRRRRDAEAQS